MKYSDGDFVAVMLRQDFCAFVHRCFKTVNPGAKYLDNWHIKAVGYQLDRIRHGESTRQIFNLPPRSLKSLIISVAFPAFLLGHNPKLRIFCISYSNELAEKHASDFRLVVESTWYKAAFPNTRFDRFAGADAFTASLGYRKATSTGATLTGMGGDVLIVDDPIKPQDAQSEAHRNRVNDWFFSTLISRLDDKRKGALIVNMQRVHSQDLIGYLLENSDNWDLLSLPAIAEAEEHVPVGPGEVHIRRPGEALHPEREPIETLQQLRRELGADVFSAQYQQAPVPPGGAMIKRDWLRYYDEAPDLADGIIMLSWDCAGKAGILNDYSVCTVWLRTSRQRYYLLHMTRGRFEYPQLRRKALALAEQYRPHYILIEDSSAGQALAQDLREDGDYNIVPIAVETNRISRVFIQQQKFEAGQVRFPKDAPFMAEVETELLSFPQGKTDDIVDSIMQALAYKILNFDSSYSWVGDFVESEHPLAVHQRKMERERQQRARAEDDEDNS